MTWVDLIVLGVLAVSGLLAFARGFVREVLGVSSWIGAVLFTWWGFPIARLRFEQWLGGPEWAGFATVGALFIGSLLVLMLIAHWIGAIVQDSALGGIDRTLGLLFGLVRGALLVVFAYIAVSMVIPIERWPEPVLRARSLPLAYAGAAWAIARLPPEARPHLSPPPERASSAAELLQAQPAGRATRLPSQN
jgi:membrane protein required for colicin V production